MPDDAQHGYRRAISTTMPLTTPFREATLGDGSPRPPYDAVFPPLRGTDLGAVQAEIGERLAADGVTFGVDQPLRVDAVPRLIAAHEWAELERGLVQRTRALDAFVRDVYGRQRIVREGILSATAVASAEFFEPLLQGALTDGRRRITLAGLDLVRGPDGRFRVLEDNVRTPLGLGYLLAARDAVGDRLPAGGLVPEPLGPAFEGIRAALHAAGTQAAGGEDPVAVLLTDGPADAAHWEHRRLAAELGIGLVRPIDLRRRGEDLHAILDGEERRVDVVYRRTKEDRLSDPRGGRTSIAEQLLEPWLKRRVGLVNGFGTGVADDKLVHAHVEAMIRLYLDEEPLLPSVPTWDLNVPGALARAMDELHRLVVKPRAGWGGKGIVLGPYATEAELDDLRAALRANPGAWVVQELLPLSVLPTVVDGALAPRHVDLRAFVVLGEGDEAHVIPGGLTRVAFEEGQMVVNARRGGGVKDTWIV